MITIINLVELVIMVNIIESSYQMRIDSDSNIVNRIVTWMICYIITDILCGKLGDML